MDAIDDKTDFRLPSICNERAFTLDPLESYFLKWTLWLQPGNIRLGRIGTSLTLLSSLPSQSQGNLCRAEN